MFQKLSKLKEVLKKLGFSCERGLRTYTDFTRRVVYLNERGKIANLVFLVCHEIGHVCTEDGCEDLASAYSVQPIPHCWFARESEFRAWQVADKLVKSLGLESPEYFKFKHFCLRTYYVS